MKNNTLQLRDSLATDLNTWRECAIESKEKVNACLSVNNHRGTEIYGNECDRYISMFHALVLFACSSGIISESERDYLFNGLLSEVNASRIETEYYSLFIERRIL